MHTSPSYAKPRLSLNSSKDSQSSARSQALSQRHMSLGLCVLQQLHEICNWNSTPAPKRRSSYCFACLRRNQNQSCMQQVPKTQTELLLSNSNEVTITRVVWFVRIPYIRQLPSTNPIGTRLAWLQAPGVSKTQLFGAQEAVLPQLGSPRAGEVM